MSRNLGASYDAKAQSDVPKGVWLVEIATGESSPNDYYRFCTGTNAITYGGYEYTPYPFDQSDLEVALEDAREINITLADAAGTIKALGADWRRQRVTIYRLHRDLTSAAQKDVLFVEQAVPGLGVMQLKCKTLDAMLDYKIPFHRVTRDEFPGIATE